MTTFGWVVRTAACLVVLTTATPAWAATPEAAIDADIVVALSVRADVRSNAQACREQAPEEAWQFQWGEYFWESGNLAAFRLADAIVASLPADDRNILQGRVDSSASRLGLRRKAISVISLGGSDAAACRNLVRRFSDYPHRHDLLGEGVFQRLEVAYVARQGGADAVRREVQREDMIIGCSKGQLRMGTRDFEPLHAFCACTISAMTSSATPAEVDAYIASQTRPNPDKVAAQAALMKQPWMQKAIPKMRACTPPPQPPQQR